MEAPLLIKPYLKDMTRSEIHAVMTGGSRDRCRKHPWSIHSLRYRCDPSHNRLGDVGPRSSGDVEALLPRDREIEAPHRGGHGVGKRFICSYVFVPIAFIMGVEWADCRVVAELIGLKTFVNEFYAYEVLGKYIENRTTGAGPTLSVRSEVIATYALCGFANIGSVGIVLGALGPMAPSRKGDLAAVAIRALIAGTVACFMTACLAGILYVPEDIPLDNSTTSIPPMTTVY